MIKYGIKIWSDNNQEMFQEILDLHKNKKIDFAEFYTVPGLDFKALSALKKVPITIHSFHIKHDFDILSLDENSEKMFKENVIKTADFFNSKIIVLHSGGEKYSDDISIDFKNFKKNIEKIKDKRIIIENMPALAMDGGNCFGYSLKELLLIKELGFNFCLDIAHAYKSALWQKIDYKKFIKDLIENLSPFYFHLSSGRGDSYDDQHLNIFEGDLDIKWVKNILVSLSGKKDIYLIFETPKIGDNLENDIKNIDYFKSL